MTPGATFSITSARLGLDRTLAVDRLAQRVDHAPDQLRSDRHIQDAPGRLDRVALRDLHVIAQHHDADRVALQVQRQSERVVLELEHFALHRVGQAVNAANAVGHRDHGALRAHVGVDTQLLDPAAQQLADFGWVQLHVGLRGVDVMRSAGRASRQPGSHRPVEDAIAHRHAHAADQLRLQAQFRFQATRNLRASRLIKSAI